MYSEKTPVRKVRNNFFLPLIFLVSVSAFFGSLIFYNVEMEMIYSLFNGIKCLVLMYITIYATTFLLGEITYPLDLGRDFSISFRLIVYSGIPFFLCQIVSRLFESLLFINVIALYGLYIFWTGAEKMLAPPQYKKMPMLVAITTIAIGIYLASDFILTMLVDRVYFAFFG
jgi:hypothetical protein